MAATLFTTASNKSWSLIGLSRLSLFSIQQRYLRWVIPFNKSVAGQIGPLPGTIYHLWHGELKDRNYYDRYKLLENFDPYSDIQIASNGAWQWTKLNTELEEQPRANFVNRREDG
jgi:hypothetical protein